MIETKMNGRVLNQECYVCFLLDSSQAISGSHVANATFVSVAPTLIPEGNTSGGV